MSDNNQIEMDLELKIPVRVAFHTHTTDCVNLQEYVSFLKAKGLTVGVFKTQQQRLDYFEIEFYNKEDTKIDILVCPYGEPIGETNE